MLAVAAVLTEGPFDTVAGLPVHPLVVHAAVVLLPISALALILIVFVKRWRGAFGWVTLAGLAIGTGAAIVAKLSGEALAERVGLPDTHASLGDRLPIVAVITFLVAIGWFVLARRDAARGPEGGRSVGTTITGIAAVIMAVLTIITTVLVGHSGAVAVWEGRVAATDVDTTSAESDDGASGATTYTLADVEAHSQPTDCWTVIDGTVYDLTQWIGEHPGGAAEIEQTCGIDATAAFEDEHAGEREPAGELAGFAIGTLGTLSSAPAAGTSLTATAAWYVSARTDQATTLPLRVKRYTMAQVRRHDSARSCWTVVNSRVYDLTGWINQHPGGASRILATCGVDATAAFTDEHAGESRATSILRSFKIGRLRAAQV